MRLQDYSMTVLLIKILDSLRGTINDQEFIQDADVEAVSSEHRSKDGFPITWSDQYSNLLDVLN